MTDADIWRQALDLFDHFGSDAEQVALGLCDRSIAEKDAEASVCWKRIAAAITALDTNLIARSRMH